MCGWDQSYTATSHSSAMLTSEGAHAMEEDDDAHHGAKMASTATTSSGSDRPETAAADVHMEMEEADMTRWTEAEFEEKCTYMVKDTAWEAGPDGDSVTTTRAEASLPRNLAFKHPADSKEVVGIAFWYYFRNYHETVLRLRTYAAFTCSSNSSEVDF
ncbi:PR domain zinc finger protein 1-like [Anarrhichthys ocellatus]|uniref:PR domain zinc finger protein 1-like n=1 Tax=Anarrhichthys ocellatus TaxID=433405 RepID=UPI0012EDE491|nr:PR domain zinc finger protein 1-like [Anarrhichthys ocellatus]